MLGFIFSALVVLTVVSGPSAGPASITKDDAPHAVVVDHIVPGVDVNFN